MRRRQVKVVGNCQANALGNFYRDFVGAPNCEDVVVVDDLGLDAPALRAACAGADLLIVQERDFKHGLSREELGGGVEVFRFPLIMAGFLWPFANEPHVHNVPERPISDGPYPSQMSDSFLNRLITKGVSPEDALEQYLALDIAKAASLDRMTEIYLDRQRERDAATGFSIAPAIEARFRTEKLFLTAEHPEANIFALVAGQLFAAMDVPADVTRAALESLVRSPFPPTELPLHPGVIAHFGLTFADADTRYTYADEGRFTFAEYVLRYMRYENNPILRHAIYMASHGDPAATLVELDRGLALSPRSAGGLRVKAALLERLGRRAEAAAVCREAIGIDPDDPDGYVDLAYRLMHDGRHGEAEEMALKAVAMVPNHAPAQLVLAETLMYAGRIEEAMAPAMIATRLMPGRAQNYRLLAMALAMAGDFARAEGFARRGMLIEPNVADHRNLVAEVMERQDKRVEAIELLEEGVAIGCDNDQTYSLLGNFWQREGALDRAEAAFGRGAALHGDLRPDLAACLAAVRALRELAA